MFGNIIAAMRRRHAVEGVKSAMEGMAKRINGFGGVRPYVDAYLS